VVERDAGDVSVQRWQIPAAHVLPASHRLERIDQGICCQLVGATMSDNGEASARTEFIAVS